MPMSQNPYAILNVSPDADPVVIEAAYKALMKKYHPDRLEAGAASIAKAAMINEAFTTLKDPKKRAEQYLRHGTPERVFVPAEPRASDRSLKVVAWSGWAAAVAFGIALALTIQAREQQLAPRQPVEIAAAAPEQEPPAPEPEVPPDPLFEAKPAVAEVAAAAAPVAAAPAVAAAARKRAASAPPAKPRYAGLEKKGKAPPRRAAPARAPRAQERDFLEREGYIY